MQDPWIIEVSQVQDTLSSNLHRSNLSQIGRRFLHRHRGKKTASDQNYMSRRRRAANAAASWRLSTPSFLRMLLTWFLTVLSLM